MDDDSSMFGLVVFLIFVMVLFFIGYTAGNYCGHKAGYIEACKDCYIGSLKYELKELPGGEKQWVKKEK